MRLFLGLFLASGFCSLVYQVVWLRLSMAQFGVTTPQVSIVLSVFMAGLGLGSLLAGRAARRFASASSSLPLRLYALAELAIALSASAVPAVLAAGGRLLARPGGEVAWGSGGYLLASGAWVTLALLPATTAMGATFPLAMWAIGRRARGAARTSFSYLYVANVIGATAGTLVSAFVLIELLGFRGTLSAAAALNALIAAAALLASLREDETLPEADRPDESPRPPERAFTMLGLLFTTGLASMAMEVVWVRQFTPYLGNVVYSFAAILAIYLSATFVGSRIYRSRAAGLEPASPAWSGLWLVAGAGTLLPLVLADPRLPLPESLAASLLRTAVGLAPVCLAFGMLTPMLVDRLSAGDPGRAGSAYAVNVLGCIVGPLLAGFLLLPGIGEKATLTALAAPLLGIGAMFRRRAASGATRSVRLAAPMAGAFSLAVIAFSAGFESRFADADVRRDSTATVVATGRGFEQRILVNGIGMTFLTPITKMMVHLPLAHLGRPPARALVICFGMGTSFRAARSWGIDTTAVELVPSVPGLFPRFHADARAILASPAARVVIDDGRRFLERTSESYDLIVVDPPPPLETAGSSLLYSREFYEALRRRLAPGGIVQQWIPGGEPIVVSALAQALAASFPHVRFLQSVEGWGTHCLASDAEIPRLTAAELARRMPPAAAEDLVEWGPLPTAEALFRSVLGREASLGTIVAGAPRVGPLTDDRPINEYFALRRLRSRSAGVPSR
ncbi:MAG: spermidine synthase [Vicinamibacteria bacterium]